VKVGLLSDTHGWVDPQVCEVLAEADCIVHAGDVLGDQVLEILADLSRQGQVFAVAGNNDRFRGSSLPDEQAVTLPGGSLMVTHGDRFGSMPEHYRLRQCWPQARAIVYGHTHRVAQDIEQEPWVLNPGAAGRMRIVSGPSCMMLTAQSGQWAVRLHQFSSFGEE